MKGGTVNSSGLVAERTDMKPAIRTLVITCLIAALLCPIQALAVELNPANQVSADEYIEAVMEEYGKYGITMRVIDDSNKLDSPILRETLETELSEIRAQCAAHATESRSELVPSNASASPLAMYSDKTFTGTVQPTALPGVATATIVCQVKATLNIQAGTLVSINSSSSYCSLGTNLSSWQQTSLTTSRTRLGSRDAIKAHLVGYAHFSYTHPQTGFNVSSSVPVDNYFTWAAI